MSNWANQAMLDLGLNWLRMTATGLYLCDAKPTTYTEASATYAVAGPLVITHSDFSTPQSDASENRYIIFYEQLGTLAIATTGTRMFAAFCSSNDLLYVAACAVEYAEAAATVYIPEFRIYHKQP